jgi:hypothetical protein
VDDDGVWLAIGVLALMEDELAGGVDDDSDRGLVSLHSFWKASSKSIISAMYKWPINDATTPVSMYNSMQEIGIRAYHFSWHAPGGIS